MRASISIQIHSSLLLFLILCAIRSRRAEGFAPMIRRAGRSDDAYKMFERSFPALMTVLAEVQCVWRPRNSINTATRSRLGMTRVTTAWRP